MCLNVDSTVSTFCANVDIVNQCRVSLRWPFSLYPSINCMTSITFPIQEIQFIFERILPSGPLKKAKQCQGAMGI